MVAKMSRQSTMPCLIDVKSHTSDRHEDPESNRMLLCGRMFIYRIKGKKVLLKNTYSQKDFLCS